MNKYILIILACICLPLGIISDVYVSKEFPFAEVGIAGSIILLQFHFFRLAFQYIQVLNKMFPSDIGKTIYLSEDIQICLSLNRKCSDEFKDILATTNDYILNNKGAVDFEIIKEITERQNDSTEKAIQSTISVPLFIGLLGTMVGIIYGLFGVTYPLTDESLSILLDGVKIAMIGSFFGLGLTIINTAWLYKQAKLSNNKSKNNYYTFIQTRILGTSTPGLSASLNSLNQRLKSFGKSFNESIGNLHSSTHDVILIAQNQINSLKYQKSIIDEIKQIGLAQISDTSLEILERLKNSMEVFDRLNSNLEPVSNLVQQNNANLEKIDQIYSRVANFNGKLQTVFENIYRSTVGTLEMGTFLKEHYSGIKTLSEGTQELVKEQKKVLSGENETFKLFLDEKQQKYTQVLDNHLNDFSGQMKLMGDKMLETISGQEKGILDLTGAFDKILQTNKKFLTDKVLEMQTEWEKSLKEVLSETKINKLEINIENLKNEFNIQNTALIEIANSIKVQANPIDEETKIAIRIIGDYYSKKQVRYKLLKQIFQFWRKKK